MNSDKTANAARTMKAGWNVIFTGDNGLDELEFRIKVENINESSQIANNISSMIMNYERPDDIFNTLISLFDFKVEIRVVLPTGTWGTAAQQEFTTLISESYS